MSAPWDVVVVYGSDDHATAELLVTHELGADRIVACPLTPTTMCVGTMLNHGWRHARGPLVAFTTETCRPDGRWLSESLHLAGRHPRAFLQGTTQPDPVEAGVARGLLFRSAHVQPPSLWCENTNVVYPRPLLEAAGGFDERGFGGEDTDLALRCVELGAPWVAAPDLLVHHGVLELSLRERLGRVPRTRALPWLVSRHPQLRRQFPLGRLQRWRHLAALAALAGVVIGRRSRAARVMTLPWIVAAARGAVAHGPVSLAPRLVGEAVADTAEIVGLARESIRHRSLFL